MTDLRPTSAVVRRVLPAPPDVAYDEWLDEAALAEFMCPYPARASRVECDPRIGGRFCVVMTSPQASVEITGEYLELDRPHRLRFTWRHAGGMDSVVTVTFEPHGDAETLMTIDHAKLPPEEVDGHQTGWGQIAELLEQKLQRAG